MGAGVLGLTDPAERVSVDARFGLRGSRPAPRDVVVVAIDDKTLDTLDERFPFRRSLHARVVRRLTAAGVRGIAYDVQFTEPTVQREDDALIEAVDAAPHVVLSTTETDGGKANVFGGDEVLRSIGARAGNTAVDVDADGILRRFAREVDGLESFPVAAVEAVTGRRVGPAGFDRHGEALIDYPGPPGTVTSYAFSDVLAGRVAASRLRGRIVVVGATVPSLGDVHATSTSRRDAMPGPEVQASAIATLLDGVPLRPLPGAVGVLLAVLLAAVAPLAGLRLGALRTVAVAAAAAALAAVGAQLAFGAGRVVPVAAPGLALALGTVGAVAVLAVYAALERERTRTLFGRFVSASFVDEVLGRADGEVRLGGVRVDATVLFCDLRDSTALLEAMEPERGIEVLNRFLSEMTDAVLAHDGTLVGFRGDGLMALFGAPLPLPDHAECALAAAEEMVGPRLAATNAWLAAAGAAPLAMGIGMDSGAVMAGNVGSQARMEYTAIGDAANVAARVEGLTRAEGRPVLLTAATRARLGPASASRLEELGERPLRGRSAGVVLWSPQQA